MINAAQVKQEFLDILENKNIQKVLDLGCGTGKMSLMFSEKNINVTGVDKKDIQIKHDNFNFVHKDIREFEFKEKYDLVIASLILNFFKKQRAIEIIKKIKESTNKRGFNLLVCLSDHDEFSKKGPDNFYPTLDYLKELYSDWKIIKHLRDFTDIEEHDKLGPHRHDMIFLLVQKKELIIYSSDNSID